GSCQVDASLILIFAFELGTYLTLFLFPFLSLCLPSTTRIVDTVTAFPCVGVVDDLAPGRQNRPPHRRCPPPAAKPAISPEVFTDFERPKPATTSEMSSDPDEETRPGRAPSASACEPYRELITEAITRGRNAMAIWQDL